jgi:hypothetical protein
VELEPQRVLFPAFLTAKRVGHSVSSSNPVYMGTVETEEGPILRIYDFERTTETAWQVDLLLPDDSDQIWFHVKVKTAGNDFLGEEP